MMDSKEKMIQKVSRLPDITENFLISLIKNGFQQVIPVICKSPYLLSKLVDAGFETDPRAKDNSGKSAFFQALKTEDSHLVSLLYDHAANACLQTDASVRSPDPVIVENLLCLKDYLKLLEKDLESDEISEKSWCLLRDLCKFNEFQLEMCKNINNIRLTINYYDQIKEFDVIQRKEVILAILTTYQSYFDYTNGNSSMSINMDDNISRFKEFLKHKDYFDKLDFSSSLMLFDNLFLLKERLELPNNAYLDVESKFFLFLFLRKYLEQYENEKHFYFVSRWITFQERSSLQRQMSNFKEILDRTELSEDNIVATLPEAAVRTLINLPEIYGQFLIFRLQHYLNAATEVIVKDLKSILVIERCLQVLGECFKESDFNSVQKILILSLPSDFIRYLKQIRNLLAHLKLHELPYRNVLQQDTELFIGIKNDLTELKKLLQPIYSIHKYHLDSFLLLHSTKSVCKARRRSVSEVSEDQLKVILLSPEEFAENKLSLSSNSHQILWKRNFDDMQASLKAKIDDINNKGNILNKSVVSLYKYIVQNMISAVKDVLGNSKGDDVEKVIEETESHFWCLENILRYVTKDRKLAEHRRSLLLLFKERNFLYVNLKEKVRHFSNAGNLTNSITNGSLSEENATAEKCSSLEPKDMCDRSQQTVNPIETFVKFGIFFNVEPDTSTVFNENLSGYLPEDFECSENSQLKLEINKRKDKNSASETVCQGGILQETIRAKRIVEVESPQKETLPEENDVNFSQVFSVASDDDWLLPKVLNIDLYYPANGEAESPAEIKESERNRSESSKFNIFIDDISKILEEYEKLADTFFQKIPGRKNVDFHFKNIEKYCLTLKGWTFLNRKEKEFIVQSVPKQFRNISELKRKVKALLKRETNFTEEIEVELNKLNLKNKEIKEIAENIKLRLIDDAEQIVDSAHDYFLDLKSQMEAKQIDKREYVLLCEKLELPDDAKNILLKLVQKQNKKIPGSEFEFIRNRIKMLKNILIDEDSAIRQLWERATTPRRQMHVKEKIVQLYLKDAEIQASVETLLFDCMTILNSKELKKLWKKTTNLFNGINLRNVLAHGHPLLESLGRLLDPYDLPSELVEKMLKLISDECVIDCMQQILEQSGSDLSGFMQIMNDEDDEQFKNLREEISECDRWKDYAMLIPIRRGRHV
ncbi:hypothetical protein HNY73_017388 [Argiope bruennichi]|uniref:Uncharacterized protein n=1 Tax=Argiope bruennichi TaxID=94029 RepID=A0A8T0ELE3_ARGBR|nr:hypothetical protein HNY73_017388 [Argiope bruennichi]